MVGVNTFESPDPEASARPAALMRASDEEKRQQITALRGFQERNAARCDGALRRLQEVGRNGENVFEELMDTVKYASLGQISTALFEVGGRYRRSM